MEELHGAIRDTSAALLDLEAQLEKAKADLLNHEADYLLRQIATEQVDEVAQKRVTEVSPERSAHLNPTLHVYALQSARNHTTTFTRNHTTTAGGRVISCRLCSSARRARQWRFTGALEYADG